MNSMVQFLIAALWANLAWAAVSDLIPMSSAVIRRTDGATGIPVTVRLSPFSIGAREVTQREFNAVAGFNPARHRGQELPVENVTWWEVIRYCNLRSMAEKLEPCYDLASGSCDRTHNGYRLPTDAEWTQALGAVPAKADLAQFAWLGTAATKSSQQLIGFLQANGTKPVGSLKANEHGVFDMLGNVWEWVQDYQDSNDGIAASVNPAGPAAGAARVVRGGSWISTTSQWGGGYRSSLEPERRSPFTGFRICRTMPEDRALQSGAGNWLAPYQQTPAAFRDQTGGLSLLTKGIPDAAAWQKQRQALRAKWDSVLGSMSCAKPAPNVRYVRTDQEPTFTGELFYLQVEPDYWEKIYVMLPRNRDVTRPLPVAIVPFYDVDTPAGKAMGGRRMNPLGTRSYGHLAIQQGMAAVAIRWYGESYGENLAEAVANLKTRHPNATGLGKWVWDSQRLFDYLATRQEFDPRRIGMIGHSLGGKMTLYATAMDERIAAAVSSEPGIGLAFSNYDDFWYLGEKMAQLPAGTDQHELLGLIAPRPFLLIGGDSADSDKSWHYINAAKMVYSLFGVPDRIGYFNHRTGHSPTSEAVRLAMEWMSHFLAADESKSPRGAGGMGL